MGKPKAHFSLQARHLRGGQPRGRGRLEARVRDAVAPAVPAARRAPGRSSAGWRALVRHRGGRPSRGAAHRAARHELGERLLLLRRSAPGSAPASSRWRARRRCAPGVISRMATADGARSTVWLPWQLAAARLERRPAALGARRDRAAARAAGAAGAWGAAAGAAGACGCCVATMPLKVRIPIAVHTQACRILFTPMLLEEV